MCCHTPGFFLETYWKQVLHPLSSQHIGYFFLWLIFCANIWQPNVGHERSFRTEIDDSCRDNKTVLGPTRQFLLTLIKLRTQNLFRIMLHYPFWSRSIDGGASFSSLIETTSFTHSEVNIQCSTTHQAPIIFSKKVGKWDRATVPPTLQLPKVGGLLSRFDKYNSLYSRNISVNRFLEFKGGMVALSHLPPFLGVEKQYFNGGLVEPWIETWIGGGCSFNQWREKSSSVYGTTSKGVL